MHFHEESFNLFKSTSYMESKKSRYTQGFHPLIFPKLGNLLGFPKIWELFRQHDLFQISYFELMKPIILLSGPVGAGKSTVARELIVCSPEPVAYIEGDTFWAFISKRDGNKSKQDGNKSRQKDFKMIMTAMTAAAMTYALYGYETILDFSIPPWFLETASRIVDKKDVPLDYVVLYPAETICMARAAKRLEGVIPDYTPYSELYADFREAGRRHLISDDLSDAAVIAGRIREGLDEGRFRLL
jgi:adenylate kinase family enzyme